MVLASVVETTFLKWILLVLGSGVSSKGSYPMHWLGFKYGKYLEFDLTPGVSCIESLTRSRCWSWIVDIFQSWQWHLAVWCRLGAGSGTHINTTFDSALLVKYFKFQHLTGFKPSPSWLYLCGGLSVPRCPAQPSPAQPSNLEIISVCRSARSLTS